MVTTTTANMIYIGNFAAMDTDEADWDSENGNIVLGTHDSLSSVEISEVDANDDGIIHDDEAGSGDYLSYDAGSGATASSLDTTAIYNADILLGDGTVSSVQVIVMQTVNGDTFVTELPPSSLDNLSIQSISLTSEDSSNYSGYTANSTSVDNAQFVCLCAGTQITTPDGNKPVQDLKSGDLVITLDHGAQEVLWTNKTITFHPGAQAPISFGTGSLGPGVPSSPLKVSPQHRMLLRSKIACRMYGTPEVLLPAKELLNVENVTRSLSFLPTTYYHFACRNHEVVFANGAEVETFFPGPMALNALSPEARQSVLSCGLLPEPARLFAHGKKARNLVMRHCHNKQRILCEVC